MESVEVMHNINFLELTKVKIVKIVGIERDGRCIIADLVTSHFGRRTQRRFFFEESEWETIKERGWVE